MEIAQTVTSLFAKPAKTPPIIAPHVPTKKEYLKTTVNVNPEPTARIIQINNVLFAQILVKPVMKIHIDANPVTRTSETPKTTVNASPDSTNQTFLDKTNAYNANPYAEPAAKKPNANPASNNPVKPPTVTAKQVFSKTVKKDAKSAQKAAWNAKANKNVPDAQKQDSTSKMTENAFNAPPNVVPA